MRRYWKWLALFAVTGALELAPGPTLSEAFWSYGPDIKLGAALFAVALLGHLFLQWFKRWPPTVPLLAAVLVASCRPTPAPPQPPPTDEPTTRALAVLVTRQDTGAPIGGATFRLGEHLGQTDVTGYGLVGALTVPARVVVRVEHPDFYPYEGQYDIAAGSPDLPIALSPRPPPLPGRADVLRYRGLLANLRDSAGRVVWTPALPGAPLDVQDEWLRLLSSAGATHVPIGPFDPGPTYPGVAWANPDWRNDASAIRLLVLKILQTPGLDGIGLRPVVFLDSGGRSPRTRLTSFMAVAVQALEGLWESVLVVPTGWEPVVGDWPSVDVSWALTRWHAYAPQSIIGYHGSPARLVGSSNPVEPDDPWQGAESDFFKTHGGQYIQIALYQTPHGRELYEECSPEADACWLNRWSDYVARIGGGLNGWRRIPLVLWETCAYEFFRGQVSDAQCREVAARGERVFRQWGVTPAYGNGWP